MQSLSRVSQHCMTAINDLGTAKILLSELHLLSQQDLLDFGDTTEMSLVLCCHMPDKPYSYCCAESANDAVATFLS